MGSLAVCTIRRGFYPVSDEALDVTATISNGRTRPGNL